MPVLDTPPHRVQRMHGFDPTDVTAQADAQAEKDARQERAREQQAEDFKRLMAEPWGRRVVWQQLERAGVYRSTFSTDALAMAFAEGQRNAGLQLLAQVHELCPQRYAVMVEEQKERKDGD